MKKAVSLFMSVCILVCFTVCFTACTLNPGKTDTAKITIGESTKFSKSEIDQAVKAIKNKFKNFDHCTMTDLSYDEAFSNEQARLYINEGKGAEMNNDANNFIIFSSSFKVDSNSNQKGLNSDSTYSSYKWILTRDSKNGKWKVDEMGY